MNDASSIVLALVAFLQRFTGPGARCGRRGQSRPLRMISTRRLRDQDESGDFAILLTFQSFE